MKRFSERKHFIVTTQPVKDLNPTILRISDYHYNRSKRSWGKVMFLQVSVILFTGWGWYPSMHCRSPGPYPGGEVEESGLGGPGPHPGGSPGPHPEGSPGPHLGDLQAHTWGGASRLTPRGWVGIPAFTEADNPADGYCCGRYASYWNAFLFPYLTTAYKLFSFNYRPSQRN